MLFRFDVAASPEAVLQAVKTTEGIQAFWTTRAEVGGTLKLGFATAPAPFDLRLDQSDDRTVAWHTETFPPHWFGTTIRWDVEPRDDGFTKAYVESGRPDPVGDARTPAHRRPARQLP